MHVRENVTQPADPSYRLISLTKSQVCAVDAADYEWLNQWNWMASWDATSASFYAVRAQVEKGTKRHINVKMHRLIMGYPDLHVDHRDLDTLNNRRYNLRVATRQQNGFNRKLLSTNTSGFKGISRNGKNWMAQIRVDGKLKYLGTFPTPELANNAYREEAIKVAGEFARW
jgi:hypothetical protein